jgi:hypothetical protein
MTEVAGGALNPLEQADAAPAGTAGFAKLLEVSRWRCF